MRGRREIIKEEIHRKGTEREREWKEVEMKSQGEEVEEEEEKVGEECNLCQ